MATFLKMVREGELGTKTFRRFMEIGERDIVEVEDDSIVVTRCNKTVFSNETREQVPKLTVVGNVSVERFRIEGPVYITTEAGITLATLNTKVEKKIVPKSISDIDSVAAVPVPSMYKVLYFQNAFGIPKDYTLEEWSELPHDGDKEVQMVCQTANLKKMLNRWLDKENISFNTVVFEELSNVFIWNRMPPIQYPRLFVHCYIAALRDNKVNIVNGFYQDIPSEARRGLMTESFLKAWGEALI